MLVAIFRVIFFSCRHSSTALVGHFRILLKLSAFNLRSLIWMFSLSFKEWIVMRAIVGMDSKPLLHALLLVTRTLKKKWALYNVLAHVIFLWFPAKKIQYFDFAQLYSLQTYSKKILLIKRSGRKIVSFRHL